MRRARLFLVAVAGGSLVAMFWWRPWAGSPRAAEASNSLLEASERTHDEPASSVGIAATNALGAQLAEDLAPPIESASDTTSNPVERRRAEVPTIEMGARPEQRATRSNDDSGASLADDLPTTTGDAATPAPSARTSTPSAAPTGTRTPSAGSLSSPTEVVAEVRRAAAAEDAGRLVEARARFNRVLLDPRTSAQDRAVIRARMQSINATLVFSTAVIDGDPLTESYTIRSGDSLSKIASNADLGIDWRFIQRVNQISDPRRIRVGQTIKLVRGPFHAAISKSEYRLDLYADMPTSAGGGRVFIASYPVGLGEYSSTPTGSWVVRNDSRLINPPWTNPRTGEYFSADNPDNPIGERWVGLRGVDDTTSSINGIGIHGTIEPESIGTDASMGCVRMLDDDVEVVYELLTVRGSTVAITP